MIFFNYSYLDCLLNVSTAIGSFHQEFWHPEFLMAAETLSKLSQLLSLKKIVIHIVELI